MDTSPEEDIPKELVTRKWFPGEKLSVFLNMYLPNIGCVVFIKNS